MGPYLSILDNTYYLQWAILLLFGVLFIFIAPLSRSAKEFFSAEQKGGKQPSIFLLTSSLVISWIFAKSITNAANLGLEFGIVGGIAYSVYYLSFVVAGIVIYRMRIKGGFSSIHAFLQSRYGRTAVVVFSVLIGFRLFNEVWSNTMIIGSYFGDIGTASYYWSILIFTFLTLVYTLKGGLRSSLLTDAIQMVFFGILLFTLLSFILPQDKVSASSVLSSGEWTMAGGVNLLLVAFVQIFSYPFHDPVLTDRGFIANPQKTLRSFLYASLIGFVCLSTFSVIGVFAQMQGLQGQATVQVGKLLGVGAMLLMNFIMITSAASTLDSAFSSFSKLVVIDLGSSKNQTIKRGRWMMVGITVLGTLPVFANPEILSATTISGTMVMGLAPIFLLWSLPTPKSSFVLSVGFGIFVGVIYTIGLFPTSLVYTAGKYATLLWANVWGVIGCFTLFLLPYFLQQWKLRNI